MTKILDLTRYDLVFTTSFEHKHGVSGHLYEMIECSHILNIAGVNTGILLSDGTTFDTFKKAITEKYDFSEQELSAILDNTIEAFSPKLMRVKNMCIVDGSARLRNAIIYADNMFLLRCAEKDFTFFNNHKSIKQTHLLQDFNVYDERFEDLNINVVNYVKKVLWHRYKKFNPAPPNTALLYLTSNCRLYSVEKLKQVIDTYNFDHYTIITDIPSTYESLQSDKVTIEIPPIDRLFDRFTTYIYTSIPKQLDCSPRFIVECAAAGKDIIYDIDYTNDPGLNARRKAIETDVNSVLLKEDDFFVEYVKRFI